MSEPIVVLATGVANVASVRAAFVRLGLDVAIQRDAATVRTAERLVLPGVGAFGAAMAELHRHGLVEALRDRLAAGRATLAICLGLQLLGRGSDESPGVAGLGVVDAVAQRFPASVCTPQLGWNQVVPAPGSPIAAGVAFFANSYRFVSAPPGWRTAVADHGGPFVAAMARGRVLACQFHPELSGSYGAAMLRRWVAAPAEVA
jgi:imidazole glycerol phosphate synthase glutamine amidotransferase subunit